MNYNSEMRIGIGNEFSAKIKKRFSLSMFLLFLYVFFQYTAQETLLPPVIHSLVMYVFILYTVLSVGMKKNWNLPLFQYSVWYVSFIAFCVLSYVWATDIADSALYTMIVTLIITYCFIFTLDTSNKLDSCIRYFVFSADAMGILLILTGQLTGNMEGERLGESVTGNANIFSALMMAAAVFAIWLVVYKTKKIPDKIFNLASFVFILYMMALSGGRKTIIAVVACTFIFIVFKNGIKSIKLLKNIAIAVFAVVIIYNAIMKIPALYAAIGQRFEELFEIFSGGTSDVGGDRTRKLMIQLALEKWQNRPILGHGLDTFKYYNQIATGHFYYAHNNYAEILYDLGIVGFMFYYGYVLKLGYSFFKLKNSEYKILGIVLIIELLFFDIGGISYYALIMQIVLCISFLCLKHGKKCVEKR